MDILIHHDEFVKKENERVSLIFNTGYNNGH